MLLNAVRAVTVLNTQRRSTRTGRYRVTVLTATHSETKTLKALANFSPGLLQPWDKDHFSFTGATLKELRRTCDIKPRNSFKVAMNLALHPNGSHNLMEVPPATHVVAHLIESTWINESMDQ